ncbi:MAG: hypothetical protein WDM71_05580 [Ferruginibacter sp.]
MKYSIFILVLTLPFAVFGQKETDESHDTIFFSLTPVQTKISNSLYNTLQVFDQRPDTADFGFMELGSFATRKTISVRTPLSQQFPVFLNSITDASSHNGTLVLQIKRFNFTTIRQQYGSKAYAFLRLRLYGKTDSSGYHQLNILDTTVIVNFGTIFKGSLQKRSFIATMQAITNFIETNLNHTPEKSSAYTISDIKNIDSAEKSRLALYTAASLKDGIYPDFTSFKNQQPDSIIKYTVRFKEDAGEKNQVGNPEGFSIDLPITSFYAIVYQGKLYVANKYGFYLVEKKGNDFYFTGTIDVSPDENAVLATDVATHVLLGSLGGIADAIAAPKHGKATFELKIDYMKGLFIPIKQVNPEKQ